MTFLEILDHQLPIDERQRLKPYMDTAGKITIGIGRNLTDCGISEFEQRVMFENDKGRAIEIVRGLVPRFEALTEARKAVLCNMAFNLGPGLRAFEKMLAAVNAGHWELAADEMKNSKWDVEVGERAVRLENAMREG